MPLGDVVKILRGVALGLAYLCGFSGPLRLMHRDLNPRNILLDKHGEPKIAYFGLAKEFDHTAPHTSKLFSTAPYMAPEMFSEAAYNERVDIFSFGHLVYSLLKCGFPHEGMTEVQIIGRLTQEAQNPNKPQHYFRPAVPLQQPV